MVFAYVKNEFAESRYDKSPPLKETYKMSFKLLFEMAAAVGTERMVELCEHYLWTTDTQRYEAKQRLDAQAEELMTASQHAVAHASYDAKQRIDAQFQELMTAAQKAVADANAAVEAQVAEASAVGTQRMVELSEHYHRVNGTLRCEDKQATVSTVSPVYPPAWRASASAAAAATAQAPQTPARSSSKEVCPGAPPRLRLPFQSPGLSPSPSPREIPASVWADAEYDNSRLRASAEVQPYDNSLLRAAPGATEPIIYSAEEQTTSRLREPTTSRARPATRARAAAAAAQKLLETTEHRRERSHEDDMPPLIRAASLGNEARLRELLAAGANKEAKDTSGRTALAEAATSGREACVLALLEAGANKETTDHYGRTPLGSAALSGHDACVRILIAAGANMEAKSNHGYTPLAEATHWGGPKQLACIRLLLEAGAKPMA